MNKTNLQGEFLTINEVKNYLKISQSAAYELSHRKDFPVCRIGGSIRVPKTAFFAWIERQSSIPAYLNEYMSMMTQGVG